MQIIREWFRRHFSDPQVLILFFILLGGTVAILTLGQIMAPVLASLVIAYLLEGLVGFLERRRIPRLAAVLIVFLTFMTFLFFLLFGLLPKLSYQIGQVFGELPSMFGRGQQQLMHLPEKYPEFISQEQVVALVGFLQTELGRMGQRFFSFSVASVRGLVTFLVYLVLLPLMVFFFLKDKKSILQWITRFLPDNRDLTEHVWRNVDRQIGNYIRGKFWEILIIWMASYLTFYLLDLRYAMLMGLLVGLSVLVPYIGVTVTTLPVALMGFFQWGFSSELVTLLIAYGIIQLLDGNLLAPLLLSEVVHLHPVAIITAVLIFGGIWGFWGVFFAIPLATLVEAVIKSWPSINNKSDSLDAS
ncbi:MAG: AI-2E family transporter [Thermodesulfobacteriota bacterium]|nr:AI-2E family transporter [Thermodesulfobacteriota bacterium]